MKSSKILLLISSFFSLSVRPSAELGIMIIKTDMEGVKKILPTIGLDLQAKAHLIELANDIILMRLKAVEIYSFKQIRQADFNVLKESLSKETIAAVENECFNAYKWAKRRNIFLGCGILSFLMATGIMHALEESHDNFFGAVFCGCICIGFFGGSIIAFKKTGNAADRMKEALTSIVTKIRNNVQKNYSDAILVKQLIINAPVFV